MAENSIDAGSQESAQASDPCQQQSIMQNLTSIADLASLDTDSIAPIPPQLTFDSVEEYAGILRRAAAIELMNDLAVIRNFNDTKRHWKAYVVAQLPKAGAVHGFESRWMLVVDLGPRASASLFPKPGDLFQVSIEHNFMVNGEPVDPGFLDGARIDNPFGEDAQHPFRSMAAIRLSMPQFNEDGNARSLLSPFMLCSSMDEIGSICIDKSKTLTIIIKKAENLTTYVAEANALEWLTTSKRKERDDRPSEESLAALRRLTNFERPPEREYDLFGDLPHMRDPAYDERLPQFLRDRFSSFNSHHLEAYKGLSRIPDRIHMVTGCPGAGKTHWNLTTAAIAIGTSRKTRILYLIDMNAAADDVANRMFCLCQAGNMKRRIIRMRGWPREMHTSTTINMGEDDAEKVRKACRKEGDFTPHFMLQAQLSISRVNRIRDQAPSLDQAAWDHFDSNRTTYEALGVSLEKALEGDLSENKDRGALRSLVFRLYSDVIRMADFIVSTPVSVWGHFPKIFKPDLIMIDEAPHFREASSLIAVGFFRPKAWIWTGDYRQTRPYVANAGEFMPKENREVTKNGYDGAQSGRHKLRRNPWARQLATSTLERADLVGQIKYSLMINHRAYGNLQALPSRLFYGEKMISGYEDSYMPRSTLHIKQWMEWSVGKREQLCEPRLLVHIKRARESSTSNSYSNLAHRVWVMGKVRELLEDQFFYEAGKASPGRIMIIAPYRSAVMSYLSEAKKLDPKDRSRIDVRTVDTAQGHEADVVFLDLVRTTSCGFMDDPHRLNVAITRARQAEIIIMAPEMGFRSLGCRRYEKTVYLHEIWSRCKRMGLIHVIN